MTRTPSGMTTTWSRNLRPSTLRHCTSRPSTMPLNRRHMYAMGRAIHVPVVQLVLSSLISLPPKVELSKMTIPPKVEVRKVTIPMVVVIVISYLSLCGWFTILWVWFTHGGSYLGRRSSEMFGRVSSEFLRLFDFGTQTYF
jgi:hypothetical protein